MSFAESVSQMKASSKPNTCLRSDVAVDVTSGCAQVHVLVQLEEKLTLLQTCKPPSYLQPQALHTSKYPLPPRFLPGHSSSLHLRSRSSPRYKDRNRCPAAHHSALHCFSLPLSSLLLSRHGTGEATYATVPSATSVCIWKPH